MDSKKFYKFLNKVWKFIIVLILLATIGIGLLPLLSAGSLG